MTTEATANLLAQSKEPMQPVRRSELLGGKRKSLDRLDWEEEKELT